MSLQMYMSVIIFKELRTLKISSRMTVLADHVQESGCRKWPKFHTTKHYPYISIEVAWQIPHCVCVCVCVCMFVLRWWMVRNNETGLPFGEG